MIAPVADGPNYTFKTLSEKLSKDGYGIMSETVAYNIVDRYKKGTLPQAKYFDAMPDKLSQLKPLFERTMAQWATTYIPPIQPDLPQQPLTQTIPAIPPVDPAIPRAEQLPPMPKPTKAAAVAATPVVATPEPSTRIVGATALVDPYMYDVCMMNIGNPDLRIMLRMAIGTNTTSADIHDVALRQISCAMPTDWVIEKHRSVK